MNKIIFNKDWFIEHPDDFDKYEYFPLFHSICVDADESEYIAPGIVHSSKNTIDNYCHNCQQPVPKEVVDKCKFLGYGTHD